jgi:integrase
MIDLHKYEAKYESGKRFVKNSNLSQHNKDLILKFDEHLQLIGVGKPRILKYFDKITRMGLWLNKDFEKITKEDVEKLVITMQQRTDLAKATKIDYNILLKRFYRWLLGNEEEFPPQVKWLKTTLKNKDKHVTNQADLITEQEAQKLIDVADHPRNKAFISLLYETGCRIGEIANLSIGSILFDQYGCVLNVSGKTGSRRIRVVNSTSYLTRWLEMHPYKNDRNKPVWVCLGSAGRNKQIGYNTIRDLLKDLFKKAEINKKCNPHIFRHSRATFMANHMTEAQMKVYFGWVQASDMASTYVHLSGRDTDNTILELNGLTKKEEKQSSIQPKKCVKCGLINSPSSNFCTRCCGVLDVETAIELQKELLTKETQQEKIGDLMGTLMKDKEFKDLLFKKITEMKLEKTIDAL